MSLDPPEPEPSLRRRQIGGGRAAATVSLVLAMVVGLAFPLVVVVLSQLL